MEPFSTKSQFDTQCSQRLQRPVGTRYLAPPRSLAWVLLDSMGCGILAWTCCCDTTGGMRNCGNNTTSCTLGKVAVNVTRDSCCHMCCMVYIVAILGSPVGARRRVHIVPRDDFGRSAGFIPKMTDTLPRATRRR